MTKINSTENKILRTIRKYNMISVGDRILVGLSGGKDSVALLYALNKLSQILKIQLVALHVNHGIRGEEAEGDEAFAKNFSKSLGIEFYSIKVDVPSAAKNSDDGVEAVARKLRYEQFSVFAAKYKCNKIATAHTASDNSETYFITLLRNSNAKGIPPVRDNIIRPLIDLTANQVVDYCKLNNLSFVTDSTNLDNLYTRNFIRHEVIPSLYSLNPSFDECVSRDLDIKRSYEALCEIEAKKYYLENNNPLDLSALKKLSSNIAYRNVLYYVLKKEFREDISYTHLIEIESLINNGQVGQFIELTKGLVAYRDYNNIEFRQGKVNFDDYDFEVFRGKNVIPDSNIVLYFETEEEYAARQKNNEQNCSKINKLTKNVFIKYNIINSSLFVRSRKEGDSYVVNNMTKKIKKYMIDEKIPSHIRSRIPIVYDNSGIVWVPGLGVADRMPQETGEVFSLSIEFTN